MWITNLWDKSQIVAFIVVAVCLILVEGPLVFIGLEVIQAEPGMILLAPAFVMCLIVITVALGNMLYEELESWLSDFLD